MLSEAAAAAWAASDPWLLGIPSAQGAREWWCLPKNLQLLALGAHSEGGMSSAAWTRGQLHGTRKQHKELNKQNLLAPRAAGDCCILFARTSCGVRTESRQQIRAELPETDSFRKIVLPS